MTVRGKNYKEVSKGYHATYTLSLTDHLGKSVFSKSLTKDNFREIFDGGILMASAFIKLNRMALGSINLK